MIYLVIFSSQDLYISGVYISYDFKFCSERQSLMVLALSHFTHIRNRAHLVMEIVKLELNKGRFQ